MGVEIVSRHNSVLSRLTHFARLLNVEARVEPAGLHPDDRRRPDIQLDLPNGILLGDVTVSHPLAKSWRKVAATRGVEAVGDAREAKKDGLYADMAKDCGMQFTAIVLYTYGGFHSSALKFITAMSKAVDPDTCLTSPSRWKQDLMEQMAVAVQRGNANIMMQAANRQRRALWSATRPTRHRPLLSRTPCPSGRGRQGAGDVAVGDEGETPDSRAMACVARLIGLSQSEVACVDACRDVVDSDVETAVEADNAPSPTSSVIPETPLSPERGRQTGAAVSDADMQTECPRGVERCAAACDGDSDVELHEAQVEGSCAVLGQVAVGGPGVAAIGEESGMEVDVEEESVGIAGRGAV
jgi:hypothetical protein